jgi:hypothetical protein
MTRMKTIGAAVILSAAIASPVFAQGAGAGGPGSRPHAFYRTSDPVNAASYAAPLTNDEYWNLQNFGTTGRNPSRVGGEVPWLNPPS